ncbi:MAG: NAD(P)/FAD-dependent oxidoreductase [Alphaproteobacteria bacterium]
MGTFSENTPVRFNDALPEAVDVVVIGGGIAGVATAWFLAQRGKKVLVAEKGRVAGEQSSRNWGWVRQQGRDWAELPIMMESNRIWRGLAQETGEPDLAFTQSSNTKLAESAETLAGYEAWRELSMQHQLETNILTAEQVAERFPDVKGDFVGGMDTPSDGRGEPWLAVPALARAAQKKGVAVIENCAVRTLDLKGGKVVGVVTEKGRVACDQVLLAAGAWSTFFADNSGINLPQLAVRSTAGRTEASPEFYSNNIYVPGLSLRRRSDGGYTVSTGDIAEHYVSPKSFRYFTRFLTLMKVASRDIQIRPAAPKGYPGSWGMARRWSGDETTPFERMRVLNPAPSQEAVRRMEERLPQRFPKLAGVKLAESWAGMIDVTPDAVPTLGELDIPGLYVATGLSGHGFGIGPAVGRIMADMISGRDAGHDLSRFRPERFFDGSPIKPGPY